jgi:acyl carrier protein
MAMEQKLKQIMSNIFGIEEDEITDDSSIDNIEKWDSLKHINLIIAIEEQFGISIDEDEMVEMTSFTEIKRILRDNGVGI